ncbi:septum site-determining protein MinC [Gorillibacterium sp. CAU 1737]|uniref:septum site-determining protein MinC n=1 Tax=Gorillibacterium sp. CAU 1737 TaxID=3140362 RepID=UPI0032609630
MNKPTKGKPPKDTPPTGNGAARHHVTIKGVKDGLIFQLDDACRYTELIEELRHKLSKTHDQILSGPPIHIQVRLGTRRINEAEKTEILEIIGSRQNLLVQSMETDPEVPKPTDPMSELQVIHGVVRSGQTIEHDGNLMLLGDVNPGGTILAAGDIYVLGSLRGMAHAGHLGKASAIVAASHMRPTQLRIAGIISRPPDEWGVDKDAYMEFAYIRDDAMVIDKINQLHRLRPDAKYMLLKGE